MIKAIEFVVSFFPTWTSATEEITHAADWAYTHNPFGSERMKFKSHMMPLYNDRQHYNTGAGGYLSLHDKIPSHPRA